MERLQYLCRYFEARLTRALEGAPKGLVSFTPSGDPPAGYPRGIRAPIFPILTRLSLRLAHHLRSLGYASQAIPFPVVPRGQERVRVIVHAGNTELEVSPDFLPPNALNQAIPSLLSLKNSYTIL